MLDLVYASIESGYAEVGYYSSDTAPGSYAKARGKSKKLI